MRNRNIFRMGRKKRNTLMYVILGASLVSLSSVGIVKRKRLKRLMEPFNAYISNNLFRKRKTHMQPN
jgi:hypothetical protein